MIINTKIILTPGQYKNFCIAIKSRGFSEDEKDKKMFITEAIITYCNQINNSLYKISDDSLKRKKYLIYGSKKNIDEVKK